MDLPRFELKDFRIGSMTLDVKRDLSGDVQVAVTMIVPAVEDGTLQPVSTRSFVSQQMELMDPERFRDAVVWTVCNAVRDCLLHEMDEKLWMDGKRVRNPHPLQVGQPRRGGVVNCIDWSSERYRTTDGTWHNFGPEDT